MPAFPESGLAYLRGDIMGMMTLESDKQGLT
jgi:hypothetical protein